VRGSRNSRGPVQVDSDIATVDQKRRAGVHSNPHLNRAAAQSLMRLLRSGERIMRRRKRDEERISLRVNLHAAVPLERISQSPAMLNKRLRIPIRAQLVEEAGRTFDVRKQESDSAGREIIAHLA
jgi:hypothetical protein